MSLKKLYVNICSPAASTLEHVISDNSDNEWNSGEASDDETNKPEDPLMIKPLPPRTRLPVMPTLAPIIRNRSGRPNRTNTLRFWPQPQSAVAASFCHERELSKLMNNEQEKLHNNEADNVRCPPSPCESCASEPTLAPMIRNRSGRPNRTNTLRFWPQPQSAVAASFCLEREQSKLLNNEQEKLHNNEADNVRCPPSPCESCASDIKCETKVWDNLVEFETSIDIKTTDKKSLNHTIPTDALKNDEIGVEFACNRPKCTFVGRSRREVNVHKRGVHCNSKDYACDQCAYRAHAGSDLRKHYRTHSGEQPYTCPHDGCHFKGKHSNNLDYHKRKMHPTGEPLKCEYKGCDYTTRFPPALRIHGIKKHSGEKTVVCDLCPYRCYLRGELRKHMLCHSAETPYACDFPGCGYACKLSSNLRKHRRSHTEERPYACEQCAFRSNFISSLKAHRRIHTDERPYCCDQCGYRCNSASNLKKHISQRHPGTPYTTKPKLFTSRGDDRVKQSLSHQAGATAVEPCGVLNQPSHMLFRNLCQIQRVSNVHS